MDVIDGNWIKARLTGERGEQARLAEAMGIDNDKISKVLKGIRRVQPDEIPRVLAFFQAEQADADDPALQELRNLWPELSPEDRIFLRNAAKAQIAARHQALEQDQEED